MVSTDGENVVQHPEYEHTLFGETRQAHKPKSPKQRKPMLTIVVLPDRRSGTRLKATFIGASWCFISPWLRGDFGSFSQNKHLRKKEKATS